LKLTAAWPCLVDNTSAEGPTMSVSPLVSWALLDSIAASLHMPTLPAQHTRPLHTGRFGRHHAKSFTIISKVSQGIIKARGYRVHLPATIFVRKLSLRQLGQNQEKHSQRRETPTLPIHEQDCRFKDTCFECELKAW
jgi:hypothetical protein